MWRAMQAGEGWGLTRFNAGVSRARFGFTFPRARRYHFAMDDLLDTEGSALPSAWAAALERGETDIDAGRIVPGDRILREMAAAIADMEARPAVVEPR
jgi:predicted transcriptional regulator